MKFAKLKNSAIKARLAVMALVAGMLWLAQSKLLAHPIAQGAVQISVQVDHLDVEAHIPFEEVMIASTGRKDGAHSLNEGLQTHGAYLLEHLQVFADGARLTGRVLKFENAPAAPNAASSDRIIYQLRYDFPEKTRPVKFQ